jgi:hypothetical protein
MKIKLGLIILIICAFVLATCSTWEGNEGVVNIRIVGEKRSSASSRTIERPYPDYTSDAHNSEAYGHPNANTPGYPKFEDEDQLYEYSFKLKDFFYDIYFVKNVYPSIGYTGETELDNYIIRQPKDNNSIPKDNIGGGRENVKYGDKVACSLVPGTWILIINGSVNKEDGIRAQGVVYPVEIKPGKNLDIEIEMLYTWAYNSSQLIDGPPFESGYIAPIINEKAVVLTKGANF